MKNSSWQEKVSVILITVTAVLILIYLFQIATH